MSMKEEMIILVKKDSRVHFHYLIDQKIHAICAIPNQKMDKIVIYVHGLGSNKQWMVRFYRELLDHHIGMIAFDLPGHGDDDTDFSKFSLSLCMQYLKQVIQYVKQTYHVPIYLFGSSFGGFVILNQLMQQDDVEKTILMCPAINFCEIMELKSGISLDYFHDHIFMPLYNNIKIYQDAYMEFKKAEERVRMFHFKNIFIIHGISDKTVLYENVYQFCLKNHLELKTIEMGKHELYGFEHDIIDFLLKTMR